MTQKLALIIGSVMLLLGCTNNYIDVKTLPRPDCTWETGIWNEFDKNAVKLLVIPDHPSDTAEFFKMFSYMKAQYPDSLIKRESELKPEDLSKGLIIYGNINEFKDFGIFDLPIKQLTDGYEFENTTYQNKNDGIFYISPTRMVYTGNSLKMIWALQSTNVGFYKYIVFQDGFLSAYCLPDDRKIDIDLVRETNFNKSPSSKYFNSFVDKRLPKTTISDSVVIDICERLNLPTPDFKINAFLHDDANSVRLFSNYFGLAGCDTLAKNAMINTPALNGIHVNGLDMEIIKHETFHLLWDRLVGSSCSQLFISEGIQEYYQQLLDSSRITKNMAILDKHSDYDLHRLFTVGDANTFYGGPSENGWPIAYNISGLYVKFLIDNWGLDNFKKFCLIKDIEKAYMQVYNLKQDELKNSFSEWIEKITPINHDLANKSLVVGEEL